MKSHWSPFSIFKESCQFILCIHFHQVLYFSLNFNLIFLFFFFRSHHGQVIYQQTLNFNSILLPLLAFLAIIVICFQMTYNQMSSMVNTDITSLFRMPRAPCFPHTCFCQISFDILWIIDSSLNFKWDTL